MIEHSPRIRDCKVCMMPHDEEIHSATLDLHQWFEFQVTKNFEPECEEEQAAVDAA